MEISRRNPSEANFKEVRLGTPQTSKKSLQKRFHGEAGPSTVLQFRIIFQFWGIFLSHFTYFFFSFFRPEVQIPFLACNKRGALNLGPWDSLDLLQGSFGPSRPKLQIESENEFRGPFCPGAEAERPGNSTPFRTQFATLGPKGLNDPCAGQKFSKLGPPKPAMKPALSIACFVCAPMSVAWWRAQLPNNELDGQCALGTQTVWRTLCDLLIPKFCRADLGRIFFWGLANFSEIACKFLAANFSRESFGLVCSGCDWTTGVLDNGIDWRKFHVYFA